MSNKLALKTQIEQSLVAQIGAFAGVGGSALSPDLSAAERLKKVRPGILLLTQDAQNGPLLGLRVARIEKLVDEFGLGSDGRSSLNRALITVAYYSRLDVNLPGVMVERDLMEEIVRLSLQERATDIFADLDAGISYAEILNHISTDYGEEVRPGRDKSENMFCAFFGQEWEFKFEAIA